MIIKEALKKSKVLTDTYSSLKRGFYCAMTVLSPTVNTKLRYYQSFHKKLDLNNPKTLNEKILYMKLRDYETNPLIRQCADKYAVREYVENIGCGEILNELYGVYDSPDDIRWDILPQKFVIKWNFGCGFNIICVNKGELDIKAVVKQLKKWGRTRYYLPYSEMQYKNVQKKIIVEKFIESDGGETPPDYKIYCFSGNPYCVMLCLDRENDHAKYLYFNKDFEFLRGFSNDGLSMPANWTYKKPEGLDMAFKYAEILSKPFPFVRADFYISKGKVYFGELTFTPGGALDSARIPEVDRLFGDLTDVNYIDNSSICNGK